MIMGSEFHCRYRIDRKVMAPAHSALMRCQPLRLWVRLGMGVVFLGAALVELLRYREPSPIMLMLCLLGIYFLLSPLVWKWVLLQKADKGGEVDLRAGSEGVTGTVRDQALELAWSDARKILSRPAGIFVFFGAGSFLWLPEKGFQSEAAFEELRSRLCQLPN